MKFLSWITLIAFCFCGFFQHGCTSGCFKSQEDNFYLIPAESDVIVHLDLKKILSDQKFQKAIVKKNKDIKDFESVATYFRTEAGIELSTITSAAMFVDISENSAVPSSGALIIHAVFDQGRLLEAINKDREKKLVFSQDQGYSRLDINLNTRICLIGKEYLVIGPAKGVDRVVKNIPGRQGEINPVLLDHMKGHQDKMVSLAAVIPEGIKRTMSNKDKEFTNILSICSYITETGENYTVHASIKCLSSDSVKLISKGLSAILLLGKNSGDKDLANFLNKVQFSENDDVLNIDAVVPAELISEIIPVIPSVKVP